jgi:hypothetical protein
MAHKCRQRGVIYQIYPRSLQDSNGDGVGDFAGLMRRLDYLQVRAIRRSTLAAMFVLASP